MKKQEFMNIIEQQIAQSKLPYSKTDIRVFFHELKDSYHRDGSITNSQIQNWVLTEQDLNRLYKAKMKKDKL